MHSSCGDCPLGASIPIESAGEGGVLVDRRVFLSRAMLSAVAVVLAACGASDATGPTFSGTATIGVGDYPALSTVGGVALVSANGASIAVVRTSSASFVALSRVCPHEGGTINPSGTGFLCTKHGAQFDKSGTWTGGQRTSNMRSYATSYDAGANTLTIG
jgi:nitrite reductase/ring-hydroxylating ferredoxin subunit